MNSAKIKLLAVPYKTTAAAATAVAAGEADMMITDASSASAQWQGGRVRPVAVSTKTRAPSHPDLPTLSEEGAPGYEMTAWFATYFPARVPQTVAATMREILQKAARTKTVTDTLSSFGMTPLEMAGPELAMLAREETEKWTRLIRTGAVKLN
jgi:tripartite-type tricarboxylate transporter receptor subunit TctC